MILEGFRKQGKASFILGGQYGSEAKGAAAAFLATRPSGAGDFDIITANNGAQSGHTSTHNGVTRVTFNLPTASLYPRDGWSPLTYLNAGAIIDPVGLLRELHDNPQVPHDKFFIHPNAAVITDECRAAEQNDSSAQTKIASTRKGVGEALSRKVLRSGMLAKDHPDLWPFIRDVDLNDCLVRGMSVLVEIPQGHSLSLDSQFYPHVTSRNCTVMQAMSDAGIHPHFYHQSMLILRTFPIRVGNIMEMQSHSVQQTGLIGYSGDCFPDQREISWEELGQKAEITTVTKRVRRVFTFSELQVAAALRATRPSVIYLTFCDYIRDEDTVCRAVKRIKQLSMEHGCRNTAPEVITQWGPTTEDVRIL